MCEVLRVVWLLLPLQVELHKDNDVAQNRGYKSKAKRFVQLHKPADFDDQMVSLQLHGKNVQLKIIEFKIFTLNVI